MDFTTFETISIRNHPILDERWIQDRITANPSIEMMLDEAAE
jgi:hypothetical protein